MVTVIICLSIGIALGVAGTVYVFGGGFEALNRGLVNFNWWE